MKLKLRSLVVAALIAVPAVGEAQIDNSVTVKVLSLPFQTGGTGFGGVAGGLKATFTIDFGTSPQTFTDYLVWCIDARRPVDLGATYNFQAYSAFDFAVNTGFGGVIPPSSVHDLTEVQMGKIAYLTDVLATDWFSLTPTQRQHYQGSIWSLFVGGSTVASLGPIPELSLDDWVVLWNGQNQTFLTYVPEPSSTGLLVSGLAGMAMLAAMRRRRA